MIKHLALLLLSLTSCSLLTTKSEPIEYFTLNKVKDSCIESIEIKAPSYLLSEKIILRKGDHLIGSLNNSYWISPIQNLVTEIVTNKDGNYLAKLTIADLYFDVESNQLIFSYDLNLCDRKNCSAKSNTILIKVMTKNPIDIIKAHQSIFNKLVNDACKSI